MGITEPEPEEVVTDTFKQTQPLDDDYAGLKSNLNTFLNNNTSLETFLETPNETNYNTLKTDIMNDVNRRILGIIQYYLVVSLSHGIVAIDTSIGTEFPLGRSGGYSNNSLTYNKFINNDIQFNCNNKPHVMRCLLSNETDAYGYEKSYNLEPNGIINKKKCVSKRIGTQDSPLGVVTFFIIDSS